MAIRKLIEEENNNVVSFEVVKPNEPKLTKSSEVKKTPNNNTEERFVEPLTELEDIAKIKEYFKEKIETSTGYEKDIFARNLLLFTVGINSGYRVSDLVTLTWGDFFQADNKTFRDRKSRKEKKTGKIKQLYINKSIEKAITDYLAIMGDKVTVEQDRYIFVNHRVSSDKPICKETVASMIKDVTKACGIKGNYNTHSLRKTFGYQLYMMLTNQGNSLALPIVQQELNHRNQSDTLRYLGLHYKNRAKLVNELSL